MAATMQDTMSQHYAEQYGINFEPDSYDSLADLFDGSFGRDWADLRH